MRICHLLIVVFVIWLGVLALQDARTPDHGWLSAVFDVAIAIFAIVFIFLFLPRLNRTMIRRFIREGANRTMLGPQVVSISPEAIRQATNYSDCTYFWPSVERIVTTGEYAMIYVSAVNAIIVPRRVFEAAEKFEEFVAQARQFAAAAGKPTTPPYQMKAVPERDGRVPAGGAGGNQ